MASRRNPPKSKTKAGSQVNQRAVVGAPAAPIHNSSFLNMMPPNSTQHACECFSVLSRSPFFHLMYILLCFYSF